MKKHLLTSLIVLFFFFNLKSQNSTWYYEYLNFDSNGYVKIETTGDTIIQGKTCQVLSKTRVVYNGFYSVFDTTFIGSEYIYVTDDTTFRFKFSNFYPLYIFNGKIGDTYLTAGNNIIEGCDSTVIVTINNIGNTQINGITLRWVDISTDDTAGFNFSGRMIENIGMIDFYMFPEYNYTCIVDANEGGSFRCYFTEDSLFYSANPQNPCDYVWIGINDLNITQRILVYPNPFENKLFVELEGLKTMSNLSLKIFDIFGNEVLNFLNSDSSNPLLFFELELDQIKSGLYCIVFYKSNEKVLSKLIIKR